MTSGLQEYFRELACATCTHRRNVVPAEDINTQKKIFNRKLSFYKSFEHKVLVG